MNMRVHKIGHRRSLRKWHLLQLEKGDFLLRNTVLLGLGRSKKDQNPRQHLLGQLVGLGPAVLMRPKFKTPLYHDSIVGPLPSLQRTGSIMGRIQGADQWAIYNYQ